MNNENVLNKILACDYEKERAEILVKKAQDLMGDCPQKQTVFMLAIIAERLDSIATQLTR